MLWFATTNPRIMTATHHIAVVFDNQNTEGGYIAAIYKDDVEGRPLLTKWGRTIEAALKVAIKEFDPAARLFSFSWEDNNLEKQEPDQDPGECFMDDDGRPKGYELEHWQAEMEMERQAELVMEWEAEGDDDPGCPF